MKKKILLGILLITLCLTACTKEKTVSKGALKFKKEYESFNEKKNDYFEYRDLDIDEDNPFIYKTAEDIVKKIENKETFIVYFGDPECPWCRSVIEQAIKSANEVGIDKIYYVRIWDGFHNEILRDTYELKNGKAVLKDKGTEAYEKLIEYFDNVLDEYTLSTEDEDTIKVGEKRIFAPNFISVKKGKAKELVQGISDKQEGYNGKLTDEVLKDEAKTFKEFYNNSITCKSDC